MNICFYTDTFFPDVGGAEMMLHNLATQLQRGGDSVCVFAPKPRETHDDTQYEYSVRRFRRPFSKRFAVRQTLPELMWLNHRWRFDVLHCHAAYPQAYVATSLKRLTDIPIVVRPHGSDILPDERIRKSPRLEERVKESLANVDAVVAQGEFLRETILTLGVPAQRVHVIHNGVDLEAFRTGQIFPHRRPYVLGLGNLSYRKGFDVLIRAFALLGRQDIDLLIAGTGPEDAALRKLIADLGLDARVRLVGRVAGQRKVDIYRSAELFVCPSRREPFANVILEAQASGLAVVASSVGGNTQLVEHDKNGLLFPNEDHEALGKALDGLLDDRLRLEKLSAGADEFVQAHAWPLIAAEYRALYESVQRATGRTRRVA